MGILGDNKGNFFKPLNRDFTVLGKRMACGHDCQHRILIYRNEFVRLMLLEACEAYVGLMALEPVCNFLFITLVYVKGNAGIFLLETIDDSRKPVDGAACERRNFYHTSLCPF